MSVRVDTPLGPGQPERVVFELFGDVTPLTADNFYQLCTGEAVRVCGRIMLAHATIGPSLPRVICHPSLHSSLFVVSNHLCS
jgi:hypothetical protein